MDVLVLGWSDIVRRRVLPALATLPNVEHVHVASPSAPWPDDAPDGRWYAGPDAVERALAEEPHSVVYVTGINTVHADRVRAALASGHHVIVDKPAFLTEQDARECLDLARARDLLLAEATVWSHHEQVRRLRDVLATDGLVVTSIDATFTIPALPSGNFRTQAAAGGGVVTDMTAYAMSPGRLLTGSAHTELDARITERDDAGLPLAMSVTARYPGPVEMAGTFSMNAPYANHLRLSGDGWQAELSPAFSSRTDVTLQVRLTVNGEDRSFEAGPDDAFARFLASALAEDLRDRGEWTAATEAALADELALMSAVQDQ